MEIIELVKSRSNAEIVSANLCTGSDSKSLAIDSRTGNTFTIFPAKQLEHSSDFEIKLQMVSLQFTQSPLILSFDGRKMIPEVEKINTSSF